MIRFLWNDNVYGWRMWGIWWNGKTQVFLGFSVSAEEVKSDG